MFDFPEQTIPLLAQTQGLINSGAGHPLVSQKTAAQIKNKILTCIILDKCTQTFLKYSLFKNKIFLLKMISEVLIIALLWYLSGIISCHRFR